MVRAHPDCGPWRGLVGVGEDGACERDSCVCEGEDAEGDRERPARGMATSPPRAAFVFAAGCRACGCARAACVGGAALLVGEGVAATVPASAEDGEVLGAFVAKRAVVAMVYF